MEALKVQFPADNFTLLAVVLALPLLGAFVNGVFGKRLGNEGVRLMALSALGGAFLASVFTFLLIPHSHEAAAAGRVTWTAWQWLTISGRMGQSIPIDVAFSADALTATMMLIVTGVGFLIHLYATEYMAKDPGYARFFAYLNLFCFAMLVLIMADNLALLFVGWEGVGLCSYLLIGFWYTDEKNASAGKKAFIVNRIGDFGLLVAMAMILYYVGALRWDGIQANAGSLLTPITVWPIGSVAQSLPSWIASWIVPAKPVMVYASTLVALALFLGCVGKSAQIPLYVWLPDAMAGPTPVSALIHAATMVTAGVYLVARMSVVFLLSPAAMAVVAVTGVLTAIFAASIGLFQTDLKKVLAYSTVSQLGFMFIGVGVGAFAAGIFHVFTHAFFKACLFLGAGSVIHAMHARIHASDRSQDMRVMGGLREFMPTTRWTFLIACCAIAGFPLLSGFWSKDEILWKAFSSSILVVEANRNLPLWSWPPWLGRAIYWAGIFAATMTAFYMFRAYFLTFHGRFKGWTIVKNWQPPQTAHHDHDAEQDVEDTKPVKGPTPKESPAAMTIPLIILAAFAVVAGFFNAEPINIAPLGHRLESVFAHASRVVQEREAAKGMLLSMMLPGFAAFLAGTAGAIYIYWNQRGAPERKFARSWPRLYGLIYDKWRIDELYDLTVVGMVDALADIFATADKWIIDGILAKLTAAIVGFAGTVLRAFQTGRVQVYAASMVVGLVGIGWFVTTPHPSATVDDRNLKVNGEVVISAGQGLGYEYRWQGTGVQGADAFSPRHKIPVTLNPGETKDVVLQVRDAFGLEASHTIKLARPPSRRMTETPSVSPVRPGAAPRPFPSGTIPGERIHELLPGGKP